jgi:transcriptional regulator GlxA family with amidase domain
VNRIDSGVDKHPNVCSNPRGDVCQKPGAEAHRLLSFSAPNPVADQGGHIADQGRHSGAHRPPPARSASPSSAADLERTVLALASNAEEYWTTQEIAEFVGRSRRQVYRILAKGKRSSAT